MYSSYCFNSKSLCFNAFLICVLLHLSCAAIKISILHALKALQSRLKTQITLNVSDIWISYKRLCNGDIECQKAELNSNFSNHCNKHTLSHKTVILETKDVYKILLSLAVLSVFVQTIPPYLAEWHLILLNNRTDGGILLSLTFTTSFILNVTLQRRFNTVDKFGCLSLINITWPKFEILNHQKKLYISLVFV